MSKNKTWGGEKKPSFQRLSFVVSSRTQQTPRSGPSGYRWISSAARVHARAVRPPSMWKDLPQCWRQVLHVLLSGSPRSPCGKQNGRNHLSGNSTQKHERSESTIYICILYLWTCKMGILCFEPSGLKNCGWVIYGIKFLMMVMAMALFGKMAHVPTKAFFLGNPAYKFWCLNEFDISPVKQLTLSSQSRHMHTHMSIVILFFCTEVWLFIFGFAWL